MTAYLELLRRRSSIGGAQLGRSIRRWYYDRITHVESHRTLWDTM